MKIREERDRLRAEGEALDRNISRFLAEQQRDRPLNPAKETIFLIVTSGQAVRGFLVTDVLDRLVARFNVVVITQYAYDPRFYAPTNATTCMFSHGSRASRADSRTSFSII